ncbi:MAG: hypothetical protein GXY85_07705 [Candidatus Brocadiaceae bacterium]|nr:hypothetical protein [Candidatus Brocadiaceae bacterium]
MVMGAQSSDPHAGTAASVRPAASSEVVALAGVLEATDAVWVGCRTCDWEYQSTVIDKIVPEGSHVKEGDFLFQVDQTKFGRALKAAESALKKAELNLESAQLQRATRQGELEVARGRTDADLALCRARIAHLESLPTRADLLRAESTFAARKAMLQEAERQYAAVLELAEEHGTSELAKTLARLSRDIASAEWACAEADLARVQRGADPDELAIARLEEEIAAAKADAAVAAAEHQVARAEIGVRFSRTLCERAQSRLDLAKRNLSSTTHCAPSDGVVVYARLPGGGGTEKVAPGTEIQLSQRVAALIGGESFCFRAKASEAFLGRLQAGQAAEVRLSALPGVVLSGKVADVDIPLTTQPSGFSVARELEAVRPKFFDIVVSLSEVPDGLMPGLSGTADVVLPVSGGDAGPAGGTDGERPTGDPPFLRLPGCVDAQDKAWIFLPWAGGHVTDIADQYERVEEGDVIVRCTGDAARELLRTREDGPTVLETELAMARLKGEEDARLHRDALHEAGLRLRIAELRVAQLRARPSSSATEMAEARVRRAEAEHEIALARLLAVREAAVDSQARLEELELAAVLAGLAVEEENLRLAQMQNRTHAPELGKAERAVRRLRSDLDAMRTEGELSAAQQETAVVKTEVSLARVSHLLSLFKEQYEARVVRSPGSGHVVFCESVQYTEARLSDGDSVAGVNVGYVADLTSLVFHAVVEEPYVSRFKPGMEMSIELLCFPGRVFQGTVLGVMPILQDREEVLSRDGQTKRASGVQCGRVDIAFGLPEDMEASDVLPEMTGYARSTDKESISGAADDAD